MRKVPWLKRSNGETREIDSITKAYSNVHTEKRLYYVVPFNGNKCFLVKPLHTANENRGLLWKLGFGKKTQNSCFVRYCRLPLPTLLRRQHKHLISTISPSSFTLGFLCKIPEQKWAGVEKYSTVSPQKGTGGLFTSSVLVRCILTSGVERKTEFQTKSKYRKPLMSWLNSRTNWLFFRTAEREVRILSTTFRTVKNKTPN